MHAVAGSTVRFAPVPGRSRAAINHAGDELRRLWTTHEVGPATDDAVMAMIEFRETFQAPLKKTAMGLRSMVCSECPGLKQPNASIPVA